MKKDKNTLPLSNRSSGYVLHPSTQFRNKIVNITLDFNRALRFSHMYIEIRSRFVPFATKSVTKISKIALVDSTVIKNFYITISWIVLIRYIGWLFR